MSCKYSAEDGAQSKRNCHTRLIHQEDQDSAIVETKREFTSVRFATFNLNCNAKLDGSLSDVDHCSMFTNKTFCCIFNELGGSYPLSTLIRPLPHHRQTRRRRHGAVYRPRHQPEPR